MKHLLPSVSKGLASTIFAAGLLMGCGSDSDSSASSTSQSSSSTSVVDSSTAMSQTSGSDNCNFAGNGAMKQSDEPGAMSTMYGTSILTSQTDCYDSITISFGGTGDYPGWSVEYANGPITMSPSDLPVDIKGDATLQIHLGVWMPNIDGMGYAGPASFEPTDTKTILELNQTENFEGMTIWSVGLDQSRPFAVKTISDPPSIQIDILSTDTDVSTQGA